MPELGLKDWLAERRMKQRHLARTLDVDVMTVNRVATGERPPSSDLILRFYLAYGQDETCRVFDLPAVPTNGNGHNGNGSHE